MPSHSDAPWVFALLAGLLGAGFLGAALLFGRAAQNATAVFFLALGSLWTWIAFRTTRVVIEILTHPKSPEDGTLPP